MFPLPELAEGAFAREASLERDDPVVHFHEPLGCDIVSGSRQGAVRKCLQLQQQLFEAQNACKSLKDEQRPRRIPHLTDPGTREEERRKVCEEIVRNPPPLAGRELNKH